MADISKITLPDNVTYDLKASKVEYTAMGVIGQGTIPLAITDGTDGEIGHTGINSGTGIGEHDYLYSKYVKLPHTYSKTAHIVGYWIDGSPIYEKTIEMPSYTTISSGGSTTIASTIWDTKAIPIDIVTYVTKTNTNALVWRWVTAQINVSTGVLQIFNGRAAQMGFDTFTIQYVEVDT